MKWFKTESLFGDFVQNRIPEHLMVNNVMYSRSVVKEDTVHLMNWVRSANPGDVCRIGGYQITYLEDDEKPTVRAPK